MPESLQQLIEQHVARLRPETQRLLEVGSVAGAGFSAAAVAAGLETEIGVVEEQCEELVRQEHFLRANGTAEWPDGTVAARYGFLHALYRDVLYDRLTARRRQRLHRQIGEREEQGYGKQAREIAAELALHFERGREYHKAIQYLQYAGENASRRSANQEAINLLTKGLELLKTLPDTPERACSSSVSCSTRWSTSAYEGWTDIRFAPQDSKNINKNVLQACWMNFNRSQAVSHGCLALFWG